MLQIYIPKAIEQSCWMCTLGRDWFALPRMPPPPKPLLSHLFLRFLLLLLAFHIFCACHTARWCSTSCRQSQSDNQFFILQFSVLYCFLGYRHNEAKVSTTIEHFSVFLHTLCTIIRTHCWIFMCSLKNCSIVLLLYINYYSF